MKKWTAYITTMALASLLLVGCGGEKENNTATNNTAEITHVNFCGDCGQHKGAETCCAKDGTVCESCGFHKGAPLCCKLQQADVAGKTLCGKCGDVAGGEKCCQEGATEVCAKCKLNKGSPLCCKLNKE